MKSSILLLGVALGLGACSGSGNMATETAGNAVYNATYVGSGTLQRTSNLPTTQGAGSVQATRVSITLSQLGSNYTGTMDNITVGAGPGVPVDTAGYAGGVTGHVTGFGGTLTFVPTGCAGVLYGAFTLQSDGTLTGAMAGRDCIAGAPGDNVHITFSGLVRH